jgi:hypothetical protein
LTLTLRKAGAGYWVGLGLAGLAVCLAVFPGAGPPAYGGNAEFDRSRLIPGARRTPLPDPPQVKVGGFDHRCMECHRLFRSRPQAAPRLLQHTQIKLAHGLNDRCYNCHDRRDRDKLVLMGGQPAGFDHSTELCAKCHGPAYRDWQRGSHGKSLGSWDPDDPRRRRLGCTECHDPHAPAYRGLEPLPGPRTRLLDLQEFEPPQPEPSRSPLRRRAPANDHAGAPPAPESRNP